MIPLPEKLSAPARRALTSVQVSSLEDLTRFTEEEIAALHGIGPNTILPLKAAMAEHHLLFK